MTPPPRPRPVAVCRVRVPSAIAHAARTLTPPKGLRRGAGVTTQVVRGVEFLVADGYVPWHRDWPAWSVLVVVRNTPRSRVQTRADGHPAPQPPGTVLVVDLSAEHRLAGRRGSRGESGVWAAVELAQWQRRPTAAEVRRMTRLFEAGAKRPRRNVGSDFIGSEA